MQAGLYAIAFSINTVLELSTDLNTHNQILLAGFIQQDFCYQKQQRRRL